MLMMMMMVIIVRAVVNLTTAIINWLCAHSPFQCACVYGDRKIKKKLVCMHTQWRREWKRERAPNATSQIARIMITDSMGLDSFVLFSPFFVGCACLCFYVDVLRLPFKDVQQLVNECWLSSPVIAIHTKAKWSLPWYGFYTIFLTIV